MARTAENSRRLFMAHFASIGLGTTMLPEILWSQVQNTAEKKITLPMLKNALAMTGLKRRAIRTWLISPAILQ